MSIVQVAAGDPCTQQHGPGTRSPRSRFGTRPMQSLWTSRIQALVGPMLSYSATAAATACKLTAFCVPPQVDYSSSIMAEGSTESLFFVFVWQTLDREKSGANWKLAASPLNRSGVISTLTSPEHMPMRIDLRPVTYQLDTAPSFLPSLHLEILPFHKSIAEVKRTHINSSPFTDQISSRNTNSSFKTTRT